MERQSIKRRLEQLRELPVHPYVLSKTLSALSDIAPNPASVAQLVFSDPGLGAYMLYVSRPSSYAAPSTIPSPQAVLERIGMARLRTLLLRMAMANRFDQTQALDSEVDGLWRESLFSAACCRLIAERTGCAAPHEAYLAGLLHDLGRLALYSVGGGSALFTDYENECSHTLAGKWLAERWRLPEPLVEAIWLHHHAPGQMEGPPDGGHLLDVAMLSDALAPRPGERMEAPPSLAALPEGLLLRLKLNGEDAEQIRKAAAEAVRGRISSFALDRSSLDGLQDALRAAAIEALESQTRTEDETVAVRRQVRRLHALNQMNQQLHPGLALDEMLEILAASIRDGLGVSPGICCIVDALNQELYLATWANPRVPLAKQVVPLDRAAMAGMESGEAPVLRALQALGMGLDQAGWAGAGMREIAQWEGLVAAPMLAGDRCYGQILFDATACQFDMSGESFSELMAFASACGLAVARGRAEERLSGRIEEMAVRLQRESALEHKLLEAKRLARVGEFAAHAVRSMEAPLSAAMGHIERLAEKTADTQDSRALETVMRHTNAVRLTLANLLYLARRESPASEPCKLNYAVHELIVQERRELETQGVRVVEKYAEGLPRIMADRRLLETAITNLVQHAIHNLRENGGVLTIQTWAEPDRRAVSMRFANSGRGVPAHQIEELFEPASESSGGAGLGLAVCREIMRAHSGRLEAESDPELGTAFTLVWPAASPSVVSEEPEEPIIPFEPSSIPVIIEETKDPLERAVLVADGDSTVRNVLRKALSDRGYSVFTAESGEQAIEEIISHSPELVLLDMRLSGNGSYAVLSKLRDRGDASPVIAMMGSSRQEDVDDAMRCGAAASLRKPFQLRQLMEIVEDTIAAAHARR